MTDQYQLEIARKRLQNAICDARSTILKNKATVINYEDKISIKNSEISDLMSEILELEFEMKDSHKLVADAEEALPNLEYGLSLLGNTSPDVVMGAFERYLK